MAVKIGSNISSLQAQSRLTGTGASLDQVFERLSSGQRINRASDDAAGLSISSSLDLSARVFSVSKRNVSDVISALSIADSATEALQSITTRQRELATQASSGTFSSKQREALDAEARELTNEYNRVILTTEFNGRKLFEDPFEIMTAQVGIGEGGTIGYELASELATPMEGGSYFVLDGERNTYVWFTMDGKGSDPRPFDGNDDEKRGIQVDLVSSPGGGTLNSSVNLRFSDGASFMRGANAETVSFGLPSFGGSLWFNVDGTNTNSTSGYMDPGDYEVSISSGWSASQVRSAVVSALNTWQPGTFSLTLEGDSELIIKEANPDPSSFGYGAGVYTYGTSVIASAIQGGTVAGPTRGEVAQAVVNAINNFFNGNHSASLGSSEGEVLIEATAAGGSGSTGDVSTGIVSTELISAGTGMRLYGRSGSAVTTGDIELIDLDNNGTPDVIQPLSNGTLRVSLNSGDGTFGPGREYFSSAVNTSTSGSNAVSTADLNGDGFTDLVVGGRDSDAGNWSGGNRISVFLNRGDGTFDAEVTLGLANNSYGPVALSDVNNDGRVDILQANGSGTTSRVDVFINQGNGSFSSAMTYDLPNSGNSGAVLGGLSLADINGDGWNDLVAPISGSTYNRMAVSLNTGTGSFGSMATYSVGANPSFLTSLIDINGDNRPDIVQTAGTGANVFLNSGNGSFGSAITYAIGSGAGFRIGVQDLNGDGRPDLVRASGTAIAVRLNDGTGGFGTVTNYTGITAGGYSPAIGDVTGDGLVDIIQGSSSGINVLPNMGGGVFGTITSYAVPGATYGPYAPIVRDLNGDGLNDIARALQYGGVFSAHTNQGAGSFASTALSARLTFSDARGTAKIQHVDLTTAASAREAMDTLETRAEQISRQRAVYGGVESRLKAAASVIDSTIINYRSAESRIKDTDVAEDAASMVRLNILKQVGSSVLAQANLEPQIALRLLQGA